MRDELPRELGQILMLGLRDFQHRLDTDLRARGVTGVSKRHREVILYLGKHGPSRSVDMAQAAGIRPQSMMIILRELEDMGMVVRQPDPLDSRAKLVNFTSRGKHFIRELEVSTRATWQQYAELVGEQQLESIIGGLQSLLLAAEEQDHA